MVNGENLNLKFSLKVLYGYIVLNLEMHWFKIFIKFDSVF